MRRTRKPANLDTRLYIQKLTRALRITESKTSMEWRIVGLALLISLFDCISPISAVILHENKGAKVPDHRGGFQTVKDVLKKARLVKREVLGRTCVGDRCMKFNDPEWKNQWYLNRGEGKGMNVKGAWRQGYTGKGIIVAVIDTGVNKTHSDLQNNIMMSASIDVREELGKVNNGHGSKCAGIIASSANNSLCTVGIAFNAAIVDIALLGLRNPTDTMEEKAFNHLIDLVDVYSNSWSPPDIGYGPAVGPRVLATNALKRGVLQGRNGQGSVYVFSGGNGGVNDDSCAYNGYVNSIYTIAINSVTIDDGVPGYAENCSAVMASTYSSDFTKSLKDGIVTTAGDGTCESNFDGTSASAAMASGIIALTLEANQNLTWRDVQHIIVHTSVFKGIVADDWMVNNANFTVSSSVGFGLLNAEGMVAAARTWESVPEFHKCVVPLRPERERFIPGQEDLVVEIEVGNSTCWKKNNRLRFLEHVEVQLNLWFKRIGGLQVFLTSARGTESNIIPKRKNDVYPAFLKNFTIDSVQFWGEDPFGTWKLRFQNFDSRLNYTGFFYDCTLILYGTETDPLKRNSHVRRPNRNLRERSFSTTTASPTTGSLSVRDIIGIVIGSFMVVVVTVAVAVYRHCKNDVTVYSTEEHKGVNCGNRSSFYV